MLLLYLWYINSIIFNKLIEFHSRQLAVIVDILKSIYKKDVLYQDCHLSNILYYINNSKIEFVLSDFGYNVLYNKQYDTIHKGTPPLYVSQYTVNGILL